MNKMMPKSTIPVGAQIKTRTSFRTVRRVAVGHEWLDYPPGVTLKVTDVRWEDPDGSGRGLFYYLQDGQGRIGFVTNLRPQFDRAYYVVGTDYLTREYQERKSDCDRYWQQFKQNDSAKMLERAAVVLQFCSVIEEHAVVAPLADKQMLHERRLEACRFLEAHGWHPRYPWATSECADVLKERR